MPDFNYETDAIESGKAPVCGVDEAGRGPLAGPVVAAAVILNPATAFDPAWARLNDSKKMTANARDDLFDQINAHAMVGIGIIDIDQIDILNILGATMKAMADAVRNLPTKPTLALIDGNREPALICDAHCIVKGDSKSLSIAAASVIAKVTRDRIMADLAAQFPGYGWERNAGYGTKEHMAALNRLGVTPHHRRSFAPVRAALSE
jgi:ribonuclease HII